ncbi:MAG: phytanoyl-CoA dioxygenase family protein [Planctomycetes bacterium]|nr:phytanoyl-CoA dioxygenase family protein [Planctomycetota bacterium]
MTAATIRLTAEQIAGFHRDGFLALGPLTDPGELAELRTTYDRHFAARSGRAEGRQFDLFGDDSDPDRANVPQILGLSQDEPGLRETVLWANARSVLAQLFGAEPDYFGDHAINKPARCAKATPWHQDEAYWGGRDDHLSASIWVPLQDVDTGNGCMHFIPRSHWGEVLPHRSEGGNPAVHGLELDGDFPGLLDGAVACPLPAGGCTVHHQRTLHYTTPNASDESRRAWIMVGGVTAHRRQVARPQPWEDAKHTLRVARAREHAARLEALKAAQPAALA